MLNFIKKFINHIIYQLRKRQYNNKGYVTGFIQSRIRVNCEGIEYLSLHSKTREFSISDNRNKREKNSDTHKFINTNQAK